MRQRGVQAVQEESSAIGTVDDDEDERKEHDNKAMQFLKKIGRVGRKQDFTHAIGVDEGSAGKTSAMGTGGALRKSKGAYSVIGGGSGGSSSSSRHHDESNGLIDAMTEPFPLTALGTSWSGYTDQVMGGQSTGLLERESEFHGRCANVLRGKVRLLPGAGSGGKAGFVQMATNLVLNHNDMATADASGFDGVELDVLYEGDSPAEQFNVHLKTTACRTPQASYRATFRLDEPGKWQHIRVPWSRFVGYGLGADSTPLDPSKLIRTGIVAIGKEMPALVLGVSRYGFYKESSSY